MNSENLALPTNNELLDRLSKGEWPAFESIYDALWAKLYLSAYSLLRDQQACEDIVQDIFVQLWVKRENQQIDSLQNYLHSAVRYQVFKVIKSGHVHQELWDDIQQITDRNETEDWIHERELSQLFDKAIDELPPKCRQVFIMSRKEHLTIKEIAEKLGITTKTVENHLTYALKQLRSTLGHTLFWAFINLWYMWK